MSKKYYLPSKIIVYLRRLAIEYQSEGKELHALVIKTSKIFVREAVEYDNWNGGMDGHVILLFLPPEIYGEVTISRKATFENDILSKLRECTNAQENEYFSRVFFEDEDENDPEFQNAISLQERAQINPDTLPIWKLGYIRLFISHRDEHKAEAKKLGAELEEYGISSFVAHDTIQPMTTWQHEIVKGLETMEVMLAFITDDFHESAWTNQEVGFALGRNIPVVSLKLQKRDPAAFISAQQALKGVLNSPETSASGLYKLLADRIGQKSRIQTGLITAFVQSDSFLTAQYRFNRMEKVVDHISEEEKVIIISGYKENDQLYSCAYLDNKNNRLKKFMERVTGRNCNIKGNDLTIENDDILS